MKHWSDMTPAEQRAYRDASDRAHDLVGKRVFVPKGTALVCCTGNGAPERAGRAYEVKVNHAVGDVVRWPGTGGYWRGAHVDSVEELDR